MRSGAGVLAFLLVATGGATPASVSAQDIEAVARARGIELPPGYWTQIARDPDLFTLPNGLVPGGERGGAVAAQRTGEARLPVVLALFADSPDPLFSAEDVERTLFTGPAPKGTVTEFYEEISSGQFTFGGDVLPWVRTSLTMEDVVGDNFGLGGSRIGEYLLEALELVDPDVDFGLYDNDGPDGEPNSGDDDGIVDVLTFEFLEVAASCGGPSIWPHRSGISGRNGGQRYVTDDLGHDGSPVEVDGYIIQGVTDCTGEALQTAGTIAHELGHALGLPDYYHPIGAITPESRRWVLGCWGLMAAGSWGCGPVGSTRDPFGPTHMVSWNKHLLGWLEYDEPGVVRNAEMELPPVDDEARGLRVPLDDDGAEELLLEYRRRVGFDADLPAEGVLVVHHDTKGQRRPPPGDGDRYLLRVAEADGGGDLLRVTEEGGNRGEAGDVFGTGGHDGFLSNGTAPSIRRNEAGLPSTVTIHSIRLEDGVARVRLSTAPDPVPLLPDGEVAFPGPGPFEARYVIAGGAGPWQASVSGAPGLEARVERDELVLGGAQSEGEFDAVVQVVDALGTAVTRVVRLAVGTFRVAEERLVGHLLRSDAEPLTAAERDVLDEAGNGNGRFDVGDARAWLLEVGQ